MKFLLSCVFTAISVSAIAAEPLSFEHDIAPIFEEHCVRCHSALSAKGEFSLETSGDLVENEYVVAGDPDGSHLIDLITPANGNRPSMPEEGKPLTSKQVELVRQWVKEGATWPDGIIVKETSKADNSWWSLQPVSVAKEASSTIDAYLETRRAKDNLTAAPEADRRALIRRLYFDLTGLPPAPAEVGAFANNPSPDAYSQLVDQLLASDRFGERWARHWLDIAHYADTHGFERDRRRDNAWRYRDYVIQAFNEDKPYDQFLREQIAGDVIASNDEESVIATGFLAAGPWDYVGQVEAKSPVLRRAARALDLDDIVTQVMTSTTAMTVNCARCHDHKLDPILQREYYQLTAVFAGLKRADRDVSETSRKTHDTRKKQLEDAIAVVDSKIRKLKGVSIDLADIVGGGSGFGSGEKKIGIDPRTGKVQRPSLNTLADIQHGEFVVSDNKFVDGVFVPAIGRTTISSTGLFAEDIPANGGMNWDAIRNGPVTSQYSTVFGGTDFNASDNSMIGLHANAGITFDIEAVRMASQLTEGSLQFSTIVGYGGKPEQLRAEYGVYLDGELMAGRLIGRQDADNIEFTIPVQARFLTLVSTDGGDSYGHDQISFGNPHLTPVNRDKTSLPKEKTLAALNSERQQIQDDLKAHGDAPMFFGATVTTPPEVKVFIRGNPETPADGVVAPGALGWKASENMFGDADMPEGERRLALANWITSPENPLTARVIVNRLWHWHFGQGIVGTPSDFGYGGETPSHPELLDWLANELIESNWSLKHIHRLIVMSDAYRMTSVADGPGKAIDSDNRLLWKMNSRRLEAEAVRDAVLATSGKLQLNAASPGGPGYRDFKYQDAYAPIYTYVTADTPELWRRSVYRYVVRTTPQQFLATLDCADPANMTPERNVTTTALQSLALFNNDFMLRQSGYLAQRLTREASTLDDQVSLAFQLIFSRAVTPPELAAARQLVNTQNLMHLCRVLYNANEFVYVD